MRIGFITRRKDSYQDMGLPSRTKAYKGHSGPLDVSNTHETKKL